MLKTEISYLFGGKNGKGGQGHWRQQEESKLRSGPVCQHQDLACDVHSGTQLSPVEEQAYRNVCTSCTRHVRKEDVRNVGEQNRSPRAVVEVEQGLAAQSNKSQHRGQHVLGRVRSVSECGGVLKTS